MTFLGIDVGTSALKAVVVDARGAALARASAPYATLSPQPGWSEQRPEDWWGACRAALAELRARVDLAAVEAVGLTGQMHGSVLLDGEREVIRPALLWNDQRTADEAAEIERVVGLERLVRITGSRSFTGFTAPKLLWLRRKEPLAFKRLRHLLLPKDYIRLQLTGELATDAGDASGTGLFDVAARWWSPELGDDLELSMGVLPVVYEGPEVTGRVRDDLAAELGLRAGVPVVAGGGDQQAGAVGAGAVAPGVAMVSIGTSGVVFATADAYAPEPEGRLHAMCHAVPGAWHTMGVMLSAGGALAWLADALRPLAADVTPERLVVMASEVAPGADGLLFLPYLQGERMPVYDPQARGAFVGLSSSCTVAHLARAVLEGVALNLRQLLELTRATGAPVDEVRLIGGGAQGGVWPRVLADVLGEPVAVVEANDGAAFGAALLAAASAGAFGDVREAAGVVRLRETVAPAPDAAETYGPLRERFAALYEATAAVGRAAL